MTVTEPSEGIWHSVNITDALDHSKTESCRVCYFPHRFIIKWYQRVILIQHQN